MTLPETSKALAADAVPADELGLLRSAETLTNRSARFRRMGGNMLMYGEGQAQSDDIAAQALRSAAKLIRTLIADRATRPPLDAEAGLLDPDMPAQQLRLHMGEMTAQEERTARAAIRWANSRRVDAEAVRREAVETAAERVIDILCNDPARDEAAADRAAEAFNGRYNLASMSDRLSDLGRVLANEIRALLPAEKETER